MATQPHWIPTIRVNGESVVLEMYGGGSKTVQPFQLARPAALNLGHALIQACTSASKTATVPAASATGGGGTKKKTRGRPARK